MRRRHLLRSESKAGLRKGGIKDALGQGSRGTDRRWTKLETSLAAGVLGYDTALVFFVGGRDGTVLSLRQACEWTTFAREAMASLVVRATNWVRSLIVRLVGRN